MSIKTEDQVVHLRSEFYQRDIDISEGPFCNAVLSRAPGAPHFIAHHHLGPHGIPFEGSVKIDGKWFDIGIKKHRKPLWHERGGRFSVADVKQSNGEFGPTTVLVCRPDDGVLPSVEAAIEYELSNELPFYRKSIRVRNLSSTPIVVQNLCPEIFYMVRLGQELSFLHDFRMPVNRKDDYFAGYMRYQFPGNIDYRLEPGETIESFNIYGVFTPNNQEERTLWVNRVIKRIAPWIQNCMISLQCGSIAPKPDAGGVQQFCDLADHCSEMGIEKVTFFVNQLWTNIGDYEIRRDLFPQGAADLKRVIDYYHKKGLKVGPYTSYSIAWHGSEIREKHLDWECVGADGQRFNPGAFGNMCFASLWGDHIHKKLIWMVDELGFDEIHIDGPTSIPCHQKNHYHHNEFDYEYLNWRWERKLFEDLRKRGVYITIPRDVSYLLMGVNQLPGGYAEEDFCHSAGMEQIANCRTRMFQARYETPACGAWAFLALDKYHRNSVEVSEERPWVYDHALGGLFGYGHSGLIHAGRLCCGPKTRELFMKWTDFYRRLRDTLMGDFIHVAPPDGVHVDAVLHTNPKALTPAVAVIFNPLDREQKAFLALPLTYAGFEPSENAITSDGEAMPLDDKGTGILSVTMKPYEVRVVEFKKEQPCKTWATSPCRAYARFGR